MKQSFQFWIPSRSVVEVNYPINKTRYVQCYIWQRSVISHVMQYIHAYVSFLPKLNEMYENMHIVDDLAMYKERYRKPPS